MDLRSGEFEYQINEDGTVTVTRCLSAAREVTVPAVIDGRSVAVIGEWSFSDCSETEIVRLEEGIRCIADDAFFECGALSTVYLADSTVRIGAAAFQGCRNLCAVENMEQVREIDDWAFCESGLAEAVIPRGVTEIGDYTFSSCGELCSVTLPEGLLSIGDHAFDDCEKLAHINLPEGLRSVGADAFSGCWKLASIRLPDSLTEIGNSAFFQCPFETLRIPSGVKEISAYAFGGLNRLGEIVIPEGVAKLGNRAFFSCFGAQSVTLPDSVKEIEGNPFAHCAALRAIHASEDHPALSVISNVLFTRADRRLVTYPLRRVEHYPGQPPEEYRVPEGTRVIGAEAFEASSVSDVKIPGSVEEICREAFSLCTSLKRVTVPGSVKVIGKGAFSCCDRLDEAEIQEGTETLGAFAFYDCKTLNRVTLPASLKEIGSDAFQSCPMAACFVKRGTYAEKYCRENGVRFAYQI